MPLIYVSRNAFYDVICVRNCIHFPAIINKSTQYDKIFVKMNLLPILQPSPTKVCHVLMTFRGANVAKLSHILLYR